MQDTRRVVLAYPHVDVLFPIGIVVYLPVLASFERESVGRERLGLLPDLVGLLGKQLAFWTVIIF